MSEYLIPGLLSCGDQALTTCWAWSLFPAETPVFWNEDQARGWDPFSQVWRPKGPSQDESCLSAYLLASQPTCKYVHGLRKEIWRPLSAVASAGAALTCMDRSLQRKGTYASLRQGKEDAGGI